MSGGIIFAVVVCTAVVAVLAAVYFSRKKPTLPGKPAARDALASLVEGNARFQAGQSRYPHLDPARRALAAQSNQEDYAIATILSCSDSRVPVEAIFDSGIMDLFVVRVAGNVCNVDEAGCIEFGLASVHTPVLVVLGHSKCGAVTAATRAMTGQAAPSEHNIAPLIRSIEPAVQRALQTRSNKDTAAIVETAVIENVWQAFENLFLLSATARKLVASGEVKAVGAIYHLETGAVEWLDEAVPLELLARANENPLRAE